jgi:hypothetical protein
VDHEFQEEFRDIALNLGRIEAALNEHTSPRRPALSMKPLPNCITP